MSDRQCMSCPSIEQLIFLHQEGNINTNDDIQQAMENMSMMPTIQEWQSRPLQSIYAVVFLDVIHFRVKQEGQIVNRAAYVVLGIDLNGQKDVLGLWIGEHESSKFWRGVLSELRNRGVQDIMIACMDNLNGFSEAIADCYPSAEIQKCVIHQIRSSIKYVSYKDVKKITAALKPIYTAPSEMVGREELDRFEQNWGGEYPLIIWSWQTHWTEIATFFKYPPEIRKIIYTTSIIESYHRQLRKVTKTKSIFPTDEALHKMLYLATQEVLRNWTGKIHNWGQILLQLSIFFPDQVKAPI